jgi:hypothetical protein
MPTTVLRRADLLTVFATRAFTSSFLAVSIMAAITSLLHKVGRITGIVLLIGLILLCFLTTSTRSGKVFCSLIR